jgi:glycosyltransferase involved in cell wall biosynthesis
VTIRVAFASGIAAWGGGAEVRLLEIAGAMRDVDCEPHLVAIEGSEVARRFRDRGIEVATIPASFFFSRHGKLDYHWRARRALPRLLRDLGAEVVHTNERWAIRPFGRAARAIGTPCVVHATTLGPHWFASRNRRWIARASAVIAVNRAVAEEWRAHGVDPARLHVIYRGIATARFHAAAGRRDETRASLRVREDEVVVGVFGRTEPRKGHEAMIRVAAHPSLADVPLRVLLAGGATTRAEEEHARHLRRLVAELGQEGRAQLLGLRDDVPDLLAACDFTAAPFRQEAFGGAVAESLVAGRAVVGYDEAGIPELVRDGVEGVLVPPGDIEALAAAVRRLAADAALRRAMGEAAARRGAEFTLERQVRAIRELYDALLAPAADGARRSR